MYQNFFRQYQGIVPEELARAEFTRQLAKLESVANGYKIVPQTENLKHIFLYFGQHNRLSGITVKTSSGATQVQTAAYNNLYSQLNRHYELIKYYELTEGYNNVHVIACKQAFFAWLVATTTHVVKTTNMLPEFQLDPQILYNRWQYCFEYHAGIQIKHIEYVVRYCFDILSTTAVNDDQTIICNGNEERTERASKRMRIDYLLCK